jgi:hypothetical protein
MAVEAGFSKLRAEQLAVVHLTRRPDLIVTGLKDADYGIDLLASILKNNQKLGRNLGIRVEASVSKNSLHRRNGHIEIDSKYSDASSLVDVSFPVCLFFFTMEDDRGYWKWMVEPVIDLDSHRKLIPSHSNDVSALTDEELDYVLTSSASR